MNDPQPCKLCGAKTSVCVNIDFKAIPVCDMCCLAITKQTVATLTLEMIEQKSAQKTLVKERPALQGE